MATTFAHTLDLHIRARYPLLYVATAEEDRVEAVIRAVAERLQPARAVQEWDVVRGYPGLGTAKGLPLPALDVIDSGVGDTPSIFVLRDFHPFLRDHQVARQVRNLARTLRTRRQTVVFVSPVVEVPPTLLDDITILDFPLPRYGEIEQHLGTLLQGLAQRLEPATLEVLTKACQGMSLTRLEQVVQMSLAERGTLDESIIDRVLEEKRQAVRRTGVLEFINSDDDLDDIGGLHGLKSWLERRALAFSERARRYGLPNPKGLLLVGIQGTGKSLSAKATAQLLRVPLLRLDVGRLMGSLVGESESRVREMIAVAEAMAPTVLWIDEIDKGFRGVGSSFVGDSGTSARVFGTLITWMQEKTSPVFVVATANNIDVLPPELLRKGRFDEIFFIDLPNDAERREILEVHLAKRREHRLREFDVAALAERSAGYSGAELEQAVIDAMYLGFEARREFETADVAACLAESVPLSRTKAPDIDALRRWAAEGKARLATG
ncbi:MAG: AAA family ATPase [Fimbriimonadaceae bacterium]|nr:AAA family ATPase [Fimbriimonadaceae bacterium]